MIEVGDEIRNFRDVPVIVERVEKGRHGILCTGRFTDGYPKPFQAFILPELPPVKPLTEEPFQDWFRGNVTLANGIVVGDVCKWHDAPPNTIEEYDAEWEKTIEAMRQEELDAMQAL